MNGSQIQDECDKLKIELKEQGKKIETMQKVIDSLVGHVKSIGRRSNGVGVRFK